MKKGELLILSTEQYSDFNFSGPYEVLKDFEFADIVPLVVSSFVISVYQWPAKAGLDEVTSYLKDNGFIKEVPCQEVHLGSYGDINVTGERR